MPGQIPVYIVDQYGNPIASASGSSSTITGPVGRQADAASVSVAISTEDAALLGALLAFALAGLVFLILMK